MPDEPEILKRQAQLLELASSVRQLQQAGLDSAVAELQLRRRRAELEDLTGRERAERNGNGQVLQR